MTDLGKRFKSVRDKLSNGTFIHKTDIGYSFKNLTLSRNGPDTTGLTTISQIDRKTKVGMPTKLIPNALLPDPSTSNPKPYSYHEGHAVYNLAYTPFLNYIIHRFSSDKRGGLFFRLKDPGNVGIYINSTGSGSGSVTLTPRYSGDVAFFIPLSALGTTAGQGGEYGTGYISIQASPDAGGTAGGLMYDIAYINIRPKFDANTYKVDDTQAQVISIVGGV